MKFNGVVAIEKSADFIYAGHTYQSPVTAYRID